MRRHLIDRGRATARPKRILAACLLGGLAAAAALFAGTGLAGARSAHKTLPTLTVAYGGLLNLNPAKDCCGGENADLAYEPILYDNLQGQPSQPALATSWHWVGKGPEKTFEFTLRHNAKFSDGTTVNAAAVVKWLKYFPTTKGPADGLISASGVFDSKITAIGQWTVKIQLKKPNPALTNQLSDYVADYGSVASPTCVDKPAMLSVQTCGAGPYMLDKSATVANDHYTYVPNPYYYNQKAIYWSKIVLKVITNPTTALAALETGQVQAAWGDPSTFKAAKNAGFHIAKAPATYYALQFMDLGGKLVPALANVKVRQAINYAINRKQIVKSILGPVATPTSELPMATGFAPKVANYYPYNPAKAKKLLAQAGYAPGSVKFTMVLGTAVTTAVDLAQAVAQDLKAVGIDATVLTGQTSDVFGGKYPIWSCDGCGATPWPLYYTTYLVPGGLIQQHGWGNPTLASLYNKWLNTGKNSYLQQIATLNVTQAYAVAIATINGSFYYGSKVKNVNVSLQNFDFNFRTWQPAG